VNDSILVDAVNCDRPRLMASARTLMLMRVKLTC